MQILTLIISIIAIIISIAALVNVCKNNARKTRKYEETSVKFDNLAQAREYNKRKLCKSIKAYCT